MNETFTDAVTKTLLAAGIPPVKTVEDPDDYAGWRAVTSGYVVHGTPNYASVGIIGRDGISDSARHAERDGLMQAAHHALRKAGYAVSVNEHGNLRVTEGTA